MWHLESVVVTDTYVTYSFDRTCDILEKICHTMYMSHINFWTETNVGNAEPKGYNMLNYFVTQVS